MTQDQIPCGVGLFDGITDEQLEAELLRRARSRGNRAVFIELSVNVPPTQGHDSIHLVTTETTFDTHSILAAAAALVTMEHPVLLANRYSATS